MFGAPQLDVNEDRFYFVNRYMSLTVSRNGEEFEFITCSINDGHYNYTTIDLTPDAQHALIDFLESKRF